MYRLVATDGTARVSERVAGDEIIESDLFPVTRSLMLAALLSIPAFRVQVVLAYS